VRGAYLARIGSLRVVLSCGRLTYQHASVLHTSSQLFSSGLLCLKSFSLVYVQISASSGHIRHRSFAAHRLLQVSRSSSVD
jgi:hypothetical protein